MYSRDITILFILVCMIAHYSSLFQPFFINVLSLLLYLKITIFLYTINFFANNNNVLLSGEPTNATSKDNNGVMRPSYINTCLKVKYPLRTLLHSKTNQKLYEKHLCIQSSHYKNTNEAAHPSYRYRTNQLPSEK